MAKKIDIAGTLNAATTDGVLGFSEQIKDESKGKMQSSLNKEFGEGIERIERKSDIAYNAVKTLEGLSNANEAMQTLAGQVVQIEENKQNIASNKADADAKLTELGSEVYAFNDLYTKEQLLLYSHLKPLSYSIKKLSIYYKNGYNGVDDWTINASGVSDSNEVVVSLFNINTEKTYRLTRQLEDVKSELVTLEYEDSTYYLYVEINPYKYLNTAVEAGGLNNPSWKRIFTEKKDVSFSLSSIVYSKEVYDSIHYITEEGFGKNLNKNRFYSYEQIEKDNYVKLLDNCIVAVCVKQEGESTDSWIIDSNGIDLSNKIVVTLFNINSSAKLNLSLQLSDIRNEIVVLEFKDSIYHALIAINPYLYLNSVKEAGGFSNSLWKRIFTEKKDEKNKLSEIVYSDWAYNLLLPWKYNAFKNDKKVEEIDGAINNVQMVLYEAVPDETYFKNEDFDIDTLSQSGENEQSAYCNMPLREDGFLNSVVVKSISATSVEIFVARVDSSSLNYTIIKEPQTFSINQNGYTTIGFENELMLKKGDCVFIRFKGGTFNFKGDKTKGGYEFKSGNLVTAAVIVSAYVNITNIEYKPLDINIPNEIQRLNKDIDKNKNEIQRLNEDIGIIKEGFEHEEYIEVFSDDFSTKKEDWIFGSSWLWEEKELKPTLIGGINTEVVRLNRIYQCDKHIVRFNVKLYTDTILNIAGQRTNNNNGEGESFWQIDCAEKKMKMFYSGSEFNNWRGVDTSRVEKSTNIPFNIVDGRIYAVEIEKNDFVFTLRMYDTISADKVILENIGWNAGRLQYFYTFSLGGGTPFAISNFRISMLNKPRVVFVGDSITEGVGMTSTNKQDKNSLYNRYAEIVRKKVGNSCISAVGGDIIDSILRKFDTEYNIIKPKYLSVHIGTNGGITTNTEDKFKQVIDKCHEIGCIPIINLISCGGSGNYIAINQMILNLSKSEEYKGKFLYCRFDYATAKDNYPWVDDTHPTTISGNTTRVDSRLMTDGVHPNGDGSAKMADRYCIDIPQIFNS